MKVWILEQDISRGENLGRMVKRFLENAGAGSRITMYQRPVEVVSALKQHKGKPAVLFINPDAFDMKYSGLNLCSGNNDFAAFFQNCFKSRDRKSTRLNSIHRHTSRMPSSA